MPIRMVKDPGNDKPRRVRSSNTSSSSSSGLSGLAGGLGNLAGVVLPYLIKKPKLLIVLIVLAVIGYFLFGRGCTADNNVVSSLFNTGGEFNKEVYESTEIYEPLADNIKNPLPEKVSLAKYAPTRLNQGRQGSCVAWASAYAARTILEAQRTGANPNSVRYSPSFMYNQISIDHNTCQGSYIKLAMDNMMEKGAVPFNDFRYDDSDCNRQPSRALIASASANKIKGFQRLTEEGQSPVKEMLSIKQNLSKGSPVIIGMMVGGSFMQSMNGKDVWIPTNSDYTKRGFGGQAMCVIGYDDYKEGGSFQIMNSWGEDWGNKGIAWVRYTDFKEFNVESYGLYPMGDASKKQENSFDGSFGLELNDGKKTIALRRVDDIYFETVGTVNTSDKFKVEFTNNIECYTYIFGEETDGSSYALFPYTKKHSPYCGITGTRLFPRDYSMQSDGKGGTDKIAVLVTRKPIDYEKMTTQISAASGTDYQTKVKNALASLYESNVRFSGNQVIDFTTTTSEDKGVVFVIGVKK